MTIFDRDAFPFYEGTPAQPVRDCKETLEKVGIARVTAFPAVVERYLSFLRHFGTPLGYYGDTAGAHPKDNAIWRIKYDRTEAARGATHALAGPLAVHSSQSLRDPRPPYFSMLMVNCGWQQRPPGQNGESLLVRWSDALRRLYAVSPDGYANVLHLLMDKVAFSDGSFRPLVYSLPLPDDEFDLGVRMKSDLRTYLERTRPDDPATEAVRQLSIAAHDVAHRVQLGDGDLIIVDNDRWGHGRETVIGHRECRDGRVELNPRELWSATVG